MRTVVLMMTDVVGSTRLWAAEHDEMSLAMARHHELVHSLVAARGGSRPVDQGEGDAVFAQFPSGVAALACAADVHRALAAEPWPTSTPLIVRIALHVGEVEERGGNLFGDPVNRCARLRGLASGGQTLLSSSLYEVVRDRLPEGLTLTDLGEHRLKDLSRPERVWQLSGEGLDGPFPLLAGLDRVRHNLPVQTSTFVGRERELTELVAQVREHRLVTVTGFGGMGKTRLALQAAAELADGSLSDVWFVDLSAVEDPGLVPARVAEVLGVRWGAGDPADALVNALQTTTTVLVLDNLEQVLGCAGFVADLLARVPTVRVLVTSREPLHVRGERQLPIPPLAVPSEAVPTESLSAYEAVRLFVDRAVSVRPDFVVDNATAPAVAAVCARLDGHPLALELAAARLKMLTVDKLLVRLDSALSVLTGGARDMPERHQTLRATIAWSYDALSRDEQLLLSRMSVLDGPATLETVEAVCGDSLDVFGLIEGLVDKSLVRCADSGGETRFSLLSSIRQYAAEQLDATATRELQDRYAGHVQEALSAFGLGTVEEYRGRHSWVDAELIHVRFALEHLRGAATPDAFARAVAALNDTFVHRGLVAEMGELAEEALTAIDRLDTDLPPEVVAQVLIGLSMTRSRLRTANAFASRAVEVARRCSDGLVVAETLAMAIPHAARSQSEAEALIAELDAALEAVASSGMHALLMQERHNAAASLLRFVDPGTALSAGLALCASDRGAGMAGPVRVAEILLDCGDWTKALSVLGTADDAALTGRPNPVWAARIAAVKARALIAAGRMEEAREAASEAARQEAAVGLPLFISTRALMGVEWRAADPRAAVRAADAAFARCTEDSFEHPAAAALRWRRAVCLSELGEGDEATAELQAAQRVLAASALDGPRELLGVLVARAGDLASADPLRAASICASIQAHRGDWVLPFAMDARLGEILEQLPAFAGDVSHPTEIW